MICRLLSLFLLLSSLGAYAQIKLPLSQALEMLETRNINLQQLHDQTELALQDNRDAKNALLPKLNAGASHQYNFGLAFDQIAGQLITGNRWTNFANANVSTQAVIFQGFALINQIRSSLLDLESNHIEIRSLKRSLKLDLITNYFTAITNQSLYRSSLKQLAYSKELLRLQQEQFDMGTKTLVDVSLAESQVATDQFNVLTNNNSYLNSLLQLKQLLNIPYADSLILETPADIETIVEFPHLDNEATALHGNPFIAMADLNLRKAELNKRIANNSALPTLSFSGSYGTNYSSERRDLTTGADMPFWEQVNQNRNLFLGLTLSTPILDGFRLRSARNKANIQLHIQTKEAEKIAMEQKKLYQQAIQELNRAQQEYSVSQKQFESLRVTLDAMSERYELGVASSIDFARALLEHNLSQFRVIAAQYNRIYYSKVVDVLTGKL